MSVGLYWFDYKTSLTALSFLHIFLELPLNAKSIESVIRSVYTVIKPQ